MTSYREKGLAWLKRNFYYLAIPLAILVYTVSSLALTAIFRTASNMAVIHTDLWRAFLAIMYYDGSANTYFLMVLSILFIPLAIFLSRTDGIVRAMGMLTTAFSIGIISIAQMAVLEPKYGFAGQSTVIFALYGAVTAGFLVEGVSLISAPLGKLKKSDHFSGKYSNSEFMIAGLGYLSIGSFLIMFSITSPHSFFAGSVRAHELSFMEAVFTGFVLFSLQNLTTGVGYKLERKKEVCA
ncbi:MAG: hypothetical protein QXU98_11785 [Candidatus Parvarchaeota archaeon]